MPCSFSWRIGRGIGFDGETFEHQAHATDVCGGTKRHRGGDESTAFHGDGERRTVFDLDFIDPRRRFRINPRHRPQKGGQQVVNVDGMPKNGAALFAGLGAAPVDLVIGGRPVPMRFQRAGVASSGKARINQCVKLCRAETVTILKDR